MKRREFLKVTGAASAVAISRGALGQNGRYNFIVVDGADPVAGSLIVRWAAEQLRSAIIAKGKLCWIVTATDRTRGASQFVVVAGAGSALAAGFQGGSGALSRAESFRLAPGRHAGVAAVLVSASDARGYVYGLLELAERVRFGSTPATALHLTKAMEEQPANEIRTVSRYFSSELEDKPWFWDKEMWTGYLDLLAASRFNRFCLAFGLQYDFPRGVTDDYLHLPYPYLFDVPGYDVRVMQLAEPDGKRLAEPRAVSDEEKKKNYDTLKFIAAQTAVRGLHFQLGIWTHAYQWTDSPNAYHKIEGLTPETHAPYCRDALVMILKDCPEIEGLTMRVHGESGIPEGSYDFWRTLFDAIKGCGRTVEIDMHAKGVDQKMIDIAVATGMPVKLGAKYSAEHQSLGYEQADIRALEIPKPGHEGGGPFNLSEGARSFTRYGYADFLQTGSKYKVLFRLWPGTQRHLLSADPEMAAAYGRTSHFGGAVGMDLMEPLTFKGREGSGQPGGRCAYADATLNPKYDWQKFELYYRVWGRKLYDPEADAEAWRRWLRSEVGLGAIPMETAVANASRILVLLTSAHLPSAANHSFWPEIDTNMPIVIGSEPSPYTDTPVPRCFATVSPLDPQTFSAVEEHATDMMADSSSAKYSPIEVAQWVEDFATAASDAITLSRRKTAAHPSPAFRRMEADVLIQIGLGRFFAGKLRSGVLYSVFGQSEVREAGLQALDQYRLAREAWSDMAAHAATIYRSDVSYGSIPMRRGHWKDRLAAIDKDIAAMAAQIGSAASEAMSTQNTRRAIQEAMGRPARLEIECVHTPPATLQPGEALTLSVSVPQENVEPTLASVFLRYRHVNQGERWKQVEMQGSGSVFTAVLPAEYTQSRFAMQYRFELRTKSAGAIMVPALNATLSNQPYFAVMQRNT